MTTVRRVLSLVWAPLALALFVVTFRQASNSAPAASAGVSCDRPNADLTMLERCAAADPANIERLADLAQAFATAGRRELAERAYRRALTLDPRNGDLHAQLGELLAEHGDLDGARREAELALRWHPGSTRAIDLAARSAAALPSTDQ